MSYFIILIAIFLAIIIALQIFKIFLSAFKKFYIPLLIIPSILQMLAGGYSAASNPEKFEKNVIKPIVEYFCKK